MDSDIQQFVIGDHCEAVIGDTGEYFDNVELTFIHPVKIVGVQCRGESVGPSGTLMSGISKTTFYAYSSANSAIGDNHKYQSFFCPINGTIQEYATNIDIAAGKTLTITGIHRFNGAIAEDTWVYRFVDIFYIVNRNKILRAWTTRQ